MNKHKTKDCLFKSKPTMLTIHNQWKPKMQLSLGMTRNQLEFEFSSEVIKHLVLTKVNALQIVRIGPTFLFNTLSPRSKHSQGLFVAH